MDTIRAQLIINHINTNTYASVANLCETFHVSPATMRRDLKVLESQGYLQRTHGGALKISSNAERAGISYEERSKKANPEKNAIASYAASLIEPNDTVFFDSSTIVYRIAELLSKKAIHATIITNDFLIANIINNSTTLNLIFIGGHTENGYYYTKGTFAENMLKDLYFKKAFITFDNVTLNNGLSMSCKGFTQFKKLVLNKATKKYALGEHHKFNFDSAHPFCPVSNLNAIITDSGLDEETYLKYSMAGYDIIRAPYILTPI